MGCDIHLYAEHKTDAGWEEIELPTDEWSTPPLGNRNYAVFGFLAGVRNYSAIQPIADERGLPDDVSESVRAHSEAWGSDGHSHSWLTVSELGGVDYEQSVEDRRCTIGNNGGATCIPGQGRKETLREFLGEHYFRDLCTIAASGAERIVFFFDN